MLVVVPSGVVIVRYEANGTDWKISVSDNGVGIPRSELKRIFRRFYGFNSHGASQVKGTGLGLFIVRSIARRHGGDAYAESGGEGQGSTFTLRLPRVYRV